MDGNNILCGVSAPIVEKFEYDEAIGGSSCVQNELMTFRHCYKHMEEIKTLTNAIENPNSTKLIFQKLPKHMRRRAMSHNPNRLPRKHRLPHIAQMSKSGAPAKTKRPSRKHRRKPQNLLLEYNRRQRRHAWLETHIWHAKRFHMIEKWGYKLAKSSCDKTFRSSYRATTKHCLIQDISYISCIEICGPLDILKRGFDRISNKNLGLSIAAKPFVSGQREGSIELFAIDAYPYGALGRFQFVWQRKEEGEGKHRLWLFAHPSVYQVLVNEFVKLYQLQPNQNKDSSSQLYHVQSYSNEVTNVELCELKNHLNRFRLTGPLSHSVVLSALRPKLDQCDNEKSWFTEYLNNANTNFIHITQTKYYNNIKSVQSVNHLPPNIIIALNAEDPRINRPKKRTKTVPFEEHKSNDDQLIDCVHIVPCNNGDSVIWNLSARERIQNDKVSTHEICIQRNKNILVPGERCAFENKLQAIPVLLLQRPGSRHPKRLGYGSGYDVIVPPGYGISTWMCLIMWGAKPGAMRETETIAREALEDEFLPDTEPYNINSHLEENELRKRYFNKPPSKRQNYHKLSIASPFKCPWQQLVTEWCGTSDDDLKFFVLRDRSVLEKLEKCLHRMMTLSALRGQHQIDENCLIPVSILMNNRGTASKFSIICLPKKQDLISNANKLKFGHASTHKEPIGCDANEQSRKTLRRNHLKVLKRLRRRRVRVKRKHQENSERKVIIAPPKTAKLIAEQLDTMCQLWLPSKPKRIRGQCSREVFGYLTQCQFSFKEAKVAGIGYVTILGLYKLIQSNVGQKLNQVLVRDPNSINYRLATLSIRSTW